MTVDSELLLGVDGGGTRCRARLTDRRGEVLGEGEAGPANLRLGVFEAFAAVLKAAEQCLTAAGLPQAELARTTACLALAGASEPTELATACRHPLPFRYAIITTDAEAACVGAHGGRDGAIIVVGTGSIGWGISRGQPYRVGGWGLPASDEGSGAWLGLEAIRRTLWAHDKRIGWTPLLAEIFENFGKDPHEIARWTATAKPQDYGRFAPLIMQHAREGDPAGNELAQLVAAHIDAVTAQLIHCGMERVALVGGLAAALESYLAEETRRHLVAPQGDALAGALRIAAEAIQTETAT